MRGGGLGGGRKEIEQMRIGMRRGRERRREEGREEEEGRKRTISIVYNNIII